MTQPHDHFLKFLLSQPEAAGDLLRERLPKELSVLLTSTPPELVEGSFVDGALRDHLTDRLYRVHTVDGTDALLYTLVEHKSWPERKIGWQLYRYMPRILEQWENENPKWEQLPPIICVVVYHGATEWTIPDTFQPLMAGNEALRPYLPNFRFVVVDLGRIDNQVLSANPRLHVGLLVLKYAFRKGEQRDILEEIGLALQDAPDILHQVVLYWGVQIGPWLLTGFWIGFPGTVVRVFTLRHLQGSMAAFGALFE
ncbi:MAG: Rpn family recombination-promoting nuclease/putative transposase, partial [Magnetococcales bacterium]|nr:Rpn family recombination-promoting nuclease/putative transposase [Magnetococcales bacterium]